MVSMTLAMSRVARLSPAGLLAFWPFSGEFNALDWVQGKMSSYGYPVLFGLLFSCGLGVPLPEDVPLLLAGWFVAKGKMDLAAAAAAAWLGIIGGDCMLYGFGRRYGMAVLKVPVIGRHIKAKQIEGLHVKFERYGVWVVGVGRMFAGVRGAMVLVAGIIRFNFVHFIVADGLAAILSGGLFMGLGYWAATKFPDLHKLHDEIKQYQFYVFLGLVAVVLAIVGYVVWNHRRKRRATIAIVSRPLATAEPTTAVPTADH